MQEKDFQVLFGKKNKMFGLFELKLEKGKSFRFDRVAPHQREALIKASTTGLYHKINDAPIYAGMKTRFTNKKPADCFNIKEQDAYVVIMWYVPRKKKRVMYFLIDDFLRAERSTKKKSAREEELAQYALHEDYY